MNAPRSASASTTSTWSGSPKTTSADPRSACTALRTSSRWPSDASAPIRTDSSAGLPTVTFASRAAIASVTSPAMPAGTITRRIAVHFWPALTVISVTTPLTNRSNSGSLEVTSGPSTEQFSESASTPSWTPPWSTDGCCRRWAPVCAEPVNATESCARSSSSRPAGLPHSSCRAPSGSRPASRIRRTTSSVRYAVWLAGFTIVGRPARNAGASFSSIPQTGKLNALICTATPGREV